MKSRISDRKPWSRYRVIAQGSSKVNVVALKRASGRYHTLFHTANGLILRVDSTQGQSFIHLQTGGMQLISSPPSLLGAELSLQPIATPAAAQNLMPPMQPMPPMKLGDMQMQMEPMMMRMGNLNLQMGESKAKQATQRFCPQCGEVVGTDDRFCAQCGNPLGNSGQGRQE